MGDKVIDHGAAVVALERAVHICTLLANQSNTVKDSYGMRASFIVHLLTKVSEEGPRKGWIRFSSLLFDIGEDPAVMFCRSSLPLWLTRTLIVRLTAFGPQSPCDVTLNTRFFIA